MKKELALVVLALLSISVSAFGLSDITGWIVSWFQEPSPPKFVDAFVTPVKIRPGDQLVITVSVQDSSGVEQVVADVSHEKGNDTLKLVHTTGTRKEGTFQSAWIAHDTLDQKWYNITITATNKYGRSATVLVEYQDPTVSHVADQVRPGTFTSGQYIFPVGSAVGIGTTPAQPLHVNGSLNVTGNISVIGNITIGTGTVTISSSDITCANCIQGADIDESSLSGTATGLTAGGLSCSNCISGTEISEAGLVLTLDCQTNTATSASSTAPSTTATLDSGYTVTGGGCVVPNAGTTLIAETRPSGSNAWFCQGHDVSVPTSFTITAYVRGCKITG